LFRKTGFVFEGAEHAGILQRSRHISKLTSE
jgi:hypothetical protein